MCMSRTPAIRPCGNYARRRGHDARRHPRVNGYADGTGGAAIFNGPSSVAVDSSGNVYVADLYNFVVRKITPAGVVTTPYGQPGVPGRVDGIGPRGALQCAGRRGGGQCRQSVHYRQPGAPRHHLAFLGE